VPLVEGKLRTDELPEAEPGKWPRLCTFVSGLRLWSS
jgi:hypothetical protein